MKTTTLPRKRAALLAGIAALACAMAGCAPAQSGQVQASDPALQLLFFHPLRPTVLGQCRNAHHSDHYERMAKPDPADPRKAWIVDTAFELRFIDGTFRQPGPIADRSATDARPLTDVCFTILMNGQPTVSGAVVPEYSARRFDFPALVMMRSPPGEPTRYELRHQFPGQPLR